MKHKFSNDDFGKMHSTLQIDSTHKIGNTDSYQQPQQLTKQIIIHKEITQTKLACITQIK